MDPTRRHWSPFIYIRIQTTSVEMQRLLLGGGITWWFDSRGGGKKSFGIHYLLPPPTERPEDGETEAWTDREQDGGRSPDRTNQSLDEGPSGDGPLSRHSG